MPGVTYICDVFAVGTGTLTKITTPAGRVAVEADDINIACLVGKVL